MPIKTAIAATNGISHLPKYFTLTPPHIHAAKINLVNALVSYALHYISGVNVTQNAACIKLTENQANYLTIRDGAHLVSAVGETKATAPLLASPKPTLPV